MKAVLICLCMLPFALLAQRGPLEVGGMKMSYQYQTDSLTITLVAPTTGWLGIGFNAANNIVGSDLLLFHVVNGHTSGKDLFVKGFGDPREDTDLQGQNSIRILEGKETNKQTTVTFRIALNSKDSNDFRHVLGEKVWLILAYSTHDEFDHHSRMRKHIPFVFESI